MNNETIIEFGIRMMWIIMQISEAAISFGGQHFLDLHSCFRYIEPNSVVVIYTCITLHVC